jgi:LacI family transcriptional regulator
MTESRVPTLKDVAREADVHTGTASRALNAEQSHLVSEATRARVRSAADKLGYHTNGVARSLRRGMTGALGVVVADLANPFIISLLRGIEYESRLRDYMSLVAETHDDPAHLRSVVTRLLRNRVDALILSAVQLDDEKFVEEIERQVPVVLGVRGFGAADNGDDPRHLEVLQDDFFGAGMALNHLAALGHRRIAQLPGPQKISSYVGRSRGYLAAVRAQPEVHDVSTGARALEATIAEGWRLTTELLRRPSALRPTAIFAHNDLMAVGAIDALRASGLRCPEDISVVGYNDAPLIDHIDPPLTTIRLPTFELGRHAAQLAFSALDGEQPRRARVMLGPEFVERKSTCAPVA